MNYQLANGYAYTLLSAYVDIAGSRFFGVGKISWSETMEGREQIPGAALTAVAETPGMYKASVDFDILLSEWSRLIARLGTGYLLKRFNMGAQLSDPAGVLPLLNMTFPALRIGDNSSSLEQKGSIMSVKTTVGPMAAISYNGITGINLGLLGGGGANSFGGSAQIAAGISASVGFGL